MVFVAADDGTVYATTGGTGGLRRAAPWETLRVNLAVVVGSVLVAAVATVAGLRSARGPIRLAIAASAAVLVVFLGLLGYGMATVEAMDLFLGLSWPLRLARVGAAAIVIATATLAVLLGRTRFWARRTGRGQADLDVTSLLAAGAMSVVGTSMSVWCWYWQVLPL